MSVAPSTDGPRQSTSEEIAVVLHSRGYLRVLFVASVLGIPISALAFGFLAAVHKLEHLVWHSLPESLGYDVPPPWWPVAAIGLAGLLVGLTVTHLPGHGGHVPAEGLGAGATQPSAIPGVVLAASASLVLGAVVGPEAPLIAVGSGLALLAVRWTRAHGDVTSTTIIAAAGSAAAISAIFGNPLIAAVMMLEVIGLARRQTMLVVLPCLLASGVGALIFTGLGNWTGLAIGALSIPDLPPTQLGAPDLVWTVPVAAVVAVGTWGIFTIARKTARLARSRTVVVTIVAGLLAGASAAVYALLTDHSPTDVALSGQATLATLGARPESWTGGALVLLLLCKGLAYAFCLGVFRGGAVFPAIFLGAACGALAATVLPGLGGVAALAIGMGAGAAVTGLPVTATVLVVLLLGDPAQELMPVVILATVTALVIEELLLTSTGSTGTASEAAAP